MPLERRRRPREYFTRLLSEIAAEVAERPVHEVRCRPGFMSPYTSKFQIAALWAFGSWARGAMACGDLDLIVEVEVMDGGFRPTDEAVASAVRRRRRHIEVHLGNPESGHLKELAGDAVLVWSVDRPDHGRAIAAVRADPSAGRFERPTDLLPIDPRRHLMGFDERDALPAAIMEERVVLTWRPCGVLPSMPVELETWAERRHLGKASRKVLPLLIEELARWIPVSDIVESWKARTRTSFRAAGVHLAIERWHHQHTDLDRLDCRAIVMVPHWTKDGPNGSLVLTRGPRHPLVRRFESARAWTIESGQAVAGERTPWGHDRTHVLEVYREPERAHSVAADREEDAVSVRMIGGTDLLNAIGSVDVVTIDDEVDVPITPAGRRYIEQIYGETPQILSEDPVERILAESTAA